MKISEMVLNREQGQFQQLYNLLDLLLRCGINHELAAECDIIPSHSSCAGVHHVHMKSSRRSTISHRGISTSARTCSMTVSGSISFKLSMTASKSLPHCILLSFSAVVISIRCGNTLRAASATKDGVT